MLAFSLQMPDCIIAIKLLAMFVPKVWRSVREFANRVPTFKRRIGISVPLWNGGGVKDVKKAEMKMHARVTRAPLRVLLRFARGCQQPASATRQDFHDEMEPPDRHTVYTVRYR